ncbi:MAG: YceI family protein [Salibacteraceae bacterium]|nr:YceI family protein [Salibacteraceae bacterium]
MKTRKLFLSAAVISMIAVSCAGSGESHTEDAANAVDSTGASASWIVDAESSNVRWEGNTAGAQVYGHFGHVKIKEGSVTTEGEKIVGGNFTIDMTTIEPKDENYSEEHPAADLVGHLTTGDFFLVEEFPTASFEVTSMDGNTVKGNLTVKGQTHEETVVLEDAKFSEDGNMMKAIGNLTFDRQKYGVAWAHYLKDVVLSDDIKLTINLVGKKA